MAFASGSVSFQRFFITGDMTKDVTDTFIESLNAKTFGKLAELPDSTQIGWIGPAHLFDTNIEPERITVGKFVHLALRVDKVKIPGNVLKSYIRMEEEVMLQASGREFLSKSERRQAKEAAMMRADQELRSGGFRRMASYPVLMDLENGIVYLGNQGSSIADKLIALFRETFGHSLDPADQGNVAYKLMNAANEGRRLENLAPSHLVNPPDDMGQEDTDLSRGELAFLGNEFLTWLWYQTDTESGTLKVRTGDDITVMIDKTVKLKCDFGITGTDVITADSPTALPEAKAALSIGKQPTKMGLIIGSPAGEFRLVLDATRFTVGSLVLPELEAELDAVTMVESRFEQISDATSIIDVLFETFLHRRTARNWVDELRSMANWAAGKKERQQALSA